MVERNLFALVCVTALAGLVSAGGTVGCSSDTTSVASGPDAGGSKGGDPSGVDSEPDTCPSKQTVDVSGLPFKPPKVVPGACTDQDRALFSATADMGVSIPQLEEVMKRRNPECAACIFGADGETWAPIVVMGKDEYVQNVGGCFAVASGNASCGKAYQAMSACLNTVCAACSDSESDACSSEVRDEGGTCEAVWNEYLVECGPDPNAIMRTCLIEGAYAVDGSILRQCGGAKADGGT